MRRERIRSYLILILLMIIGGFVGNVLGEVLSPYVPALAHAADLGFSPSTFRLMNTVTVTLGMSLHLSLLGALGALFGVLLWRR